MEWMPRPHTTENTSGEAAAEAGLVAVSSTCQRVAAAHAEETTANMRARVALITRGEEILTSVLALNLNLPSMKEGKIVILLVEEALVGSPRSMKLIATKTLTRSKGTMI
jgi:hypothetical protein